MVALRHLSATGSAGAGTIGSLNGGDGVDLAFERFGDAADPALVFAHGFGQTRGAWTDTARLLADEGWQCLAADARGHGQSGW